MAKAIPPSSTVATPRARLNRFITQAVGASSNATELVSAAKNTIRKNRKPMNEPAGMVWKLAGSVWNISVGPLSTASPAANTIGKMARPAMIATDVSAAAMMVDVLARFVLRSA